MEDTELCQVVLFAFFEGLLCFDAKVLIFNHIACGWSFLEFLKRVTSCMDDLFKFQVPPWEHFVVDDILRCRSAGLCGTDEEKEKPFTVVFEGSVRCRWKGFPCCSVRYMNHFAFL